MKLRCDLRRIPHLDFDYPRISPQPGAGGAWPGRADAFQVEELPLYPFSGEGEHAALVVEKTEVTTRDVAAGVARRLGLPSASVGYAGMKDKACLAVQAFTVTGVAEGLAQEAFEAERCRVLCATRHRNKLRLGHLKGNRFRIQLPGADAEAARAILEGLASTGVPNYFGPQRFGARGDNALQGLSVLQGRLRAGRWKRDLLVSALQSLLFNEVLARRTEEGTLGEALPGDVLRREDSGGLFVCEDCVADAPRVRSFEVSPTGPIHGKKMVRPKGVAEAAEAGVLQDLGVDEALFRGETGSRRPLRAPVEAWSLEGAEGGLWLAFVLPPGAYATAVVREVTGGPCRRGG